MAALKSVTVLMSSAAALVGILANTAQIAGYVGVTPRQFNSARPSFMPASIWNIPDPRRSGAYGHDFQSLYERATESRQHNHFTEALREYGQALRQPDATPKQKASAYSGMSYANLRLGRLDNARAAAAQALALQPESSGARIVQLKIECTAKAPAKNVADSLAYLRAHTPKDSWQERRVERDEELFVLCAYAGAKARPLAD